MFIAHSFQIFVNRPFAWEFPRNGVPGNINVLKMKKEAPKLTNVSTTAPSLTNAFIDIRASNFSRCF